MHKNWNTQFTQCNLEEVFTNWVCSMVVKTSHFMDHYDNVRVQNEFVLLNFFLSISNSVRCPKAAKLTRHTVYIALAKTCWWSKWPCKTPRPSSKHIDIEDWLFIDKYNYLQVWNASFHDGETTRGTALIVKVRSIKEKQRRGSVFATAFGKYS